MVVLSAETMLTWFYLELGYVHQLLILISLNSFIASQTFPGSLYSNLENIRPSRTTVCKVFLSAQNGRSAPSLSSLGSLGTSF